MSESTSNYSDVVEAIDAKIEAHQAAIEKLTDMKDSLRDFGELPEAPKVEPKRAKRAGRQPEKSDKTAVKRSGKSDNGSPPPGQRKRQIIDLLEKDMAVMDIARELGAHPNYVRTVKKNWSESEEQTTSSRRTRVKK